MLVLTRKQGEEILIQTDPPVWIMLVEVKGESAKIGITAPKHIRIQRKELLAMVPTTKTTEAH